MSDPAAGGAPPAVRLQGLRRSFDGGRSYALNGIDLSVDQGTFVALVGGSGSGKTTLMKTINRLIEPDEGVVFVEGRPVAATPAHLLRRKIGYVFQGVGLFPHLSVAENIGITPTLLGWPRDEIAERVRDLLDLVELPADYAERSADALSGGQRQRVGVARALAAKPAIMLMDEPFGALDPITRDSLGLSCRRLHDRLGLTTLMVTHDVFEALLLADRIVVVRDGRIAADGTPHDLVTDPPDEAVRALVEMPLRQARRVQDLLADARRGAGS